MAANPARRVVELWSLYARLDGLLVARSAKVAVAWYVSDLIVGLGAVTATFLLAERFDGIGAWSKHEVSFLLGYGLLVRGATNTLFSYNVAHISRRIGRGQLDHLLLQPQPLWMALLTEGFAPLTGAGMVVPGLGLLVWSVSQLHVPVSAAWLALLGVDLIASIAIVMAFGYTWACLAFLAPRAAEEVNSSTWRLLMELQSFPLDSLPGPALAGLLTVVAAE
jgi:ABC-2 type transport system permease protein